MLDYSKFRVLTFDCYGTMVDWESGILAALLPVFSRHSVQIADEDLLTRYAQYESACEAEAYRPYREILSEVVMRFGAEYGFAPSEADKESLANSVGNWPPFPDTVNGLQRLATRYSLAVISNIDDDLFALTRPKLKVDFKDVITAEQVRSYKPSRTNFEIALKRIGVPPKQVLHVAQSLFHDIAPARALGLATAWINRRKGMKGTGATPASGAQPDATFHSLTELAEAAGL